jgi:hypothetical protein
MTLSENLLNLETRAARLAATLDARPEIGALWRRMVAVSEASASLGLENLTVPEADILRPVLGIGLAVGEPQSARIAHEIYRTMLRPGSIINDTAGVYDRCLRAARMTELRDDHDGPRIDFAGHTEASDWREARSDFLEACAIVLRRKKPPILQSLAIARLVAETTPERLPMAERLIFNAAESDLRRDLVFSDPVIAHSIDGLEAKVDAAWVCTPALALSQQGYRAWSPISETGWSTLIERMDQSLGRNAGRLAQIKAWTERIDVDFRGKSAKSRRADFGALLTETPIINARAVSSTLSITERAARNLIDAAVEMGLIEALTGRRAYRLWAVPAMAELIRDRGTVPRRSDAPPDARGNEPKAASRPLRRTDEDFEEKVSAILGDIDAAMRGIDITIDRYRTSKVKE